MVLNLLKNNKIVSLVSDAGTPGISDPGRILINECINKKINIYPIPGPSAVNAAISISGFSDKYYFCGFLPEKKSEINKLFDFASKLDCSFVFFISPKKIQKIIEGLKINFIDRKILVCREITKFHEEYIRCNVKELSDITFLKKGEITVVISEKEKLNFNQLEESDKKEIKKLIKKMTIKDIIKKISDNKKISKKLIYSYCIGLKNEN